MRSRCTKSFWALFHGLPRAIQDATRAKFRLWRSDPSHPSLHFKPLRVAEPVWSVRISRDYRVVGLRHGDGMTWFWVGTHADYDRFLSRR